MVAVTVISLARATMASSRPNSDHLYSLDNIKSGLLFTLQHAFTSRLNLGPQSKPFQILEGIGIIEPIVSGTVTGLTINATINYSSATPSLVNNGILQILVIDVVGLIDDRQSFDLHEARGMLAESSSLVSWGVFDSLMYEKLTVNETRFWE